MIIWLLAVPFAATAVGLIIASYYRVAGNAEAKLERELGLYFQDMKPNTKRLFRVSPETIQLVGLIEAKDGETTVVRCSITGADPKIIHHSWHLTCLEWGFISESLRAKQIAADILAKHLREQQQYAWERGQTNNR